MTDLSVLKCRELQVGGKFSFMPAVTPTATQTGWAETNLDPTTARQCNCNDDLAHIMDNLGQLIEDLIAKGILSA